MRAKFFIISFLVLLFSTFSVTAILLVYFRAERLSLLDDQIREAATSIIEAKISELKNYEDDEAEELISEELGPLRIGKFFIVKNSQGQTLFETQSVALLGVEIPQSPQWVSVQTETHYLRVLNLNPSKYKSRVLQVGMIVDAKFFSLSYLSNRTYLMVAGILLLTLILTWILSYLLFSPMGRLAQYLQQISHKLQSGQEIEIFTQKKRKFLGPKRSKDEFTRLESAIEEMSQRLNEGRRFMKSWTWQMAHELKTPLAILNRDLELLIDRYHVTQDDRLQSLEQIKKISDTITSFLNWSQLTQNRKPGELFVIDPSEAIQAVVTDLNKIFDQRVSFQNTGGDRVIMNPLHFNQAVGNLLENSLKYSTGPVTIEFKENRVVIQDHGPGLPEEVLESLGQPFNKGAEVGGRGLGLGLAWVTAICEVYHITFQLSYQKGCIAVIDLTQVTFKEQDSEYLGTHVIEG